MDINEFATDAAKIEGGMWITKEHLPGLGDVELRVRGLNSQSYADAYNRLALDVPLNERASDGSLKGATVTHLNLLALHEAVLLEWKGITKDGKSVPYSKEAAGEFLLNPNLEAFARLVRMAAQIVDRTKPDEVTIKNSVAPSSGN